MQVPTKSIMMHLFNRLESLFASLEFVQLLYYIRECDAPSKCGRENRVKRTYSKIRDVRFATVGRAKICPPSNIIRLV